MANAALDDIRKRLEAVIASAAATSTEKPPRRTPATLEQQREAIEELRQSHDALARKVAELEERAQLALNGLLENFKGLRSQGIASRIQDATSVVNSVQSAAYGQRGSVLATNNLLLAGNQLLWTFIDPFLQSTGMTKGPSLLGLLAPVGSLVTGYVALGNRQHVRFITGVASFPPGRRVVFDTLRDRIADSLWPEFQQRPNIPVTATVVPPVRGFITAVSVREGVLRIQVDKRGGPTMRVAWTIDTGADVG